ncbi:hypothetical protein CR513_49666, partial [Mucuna pruriens]
MSTNVLGDKFIGVFIDDILIYSYTCEEHAKHFKVHVRSMRNTSKRSEVFRSCDLNKWNCYEPIGGENNIVMVKKIKSFVRLADYYRRFIKVSSKIVASLTQLTCKDQALAWTKTCEKSF